jgi:hypothetical protein
MERLFVDGGAQFAITFLIGVLTPRGGIGMTRTQGVNRILEIRAQRRNVLELRAPSGTVAATVEIPMSISAGAKVRLRQTAWTAAELRRLVRVLTRAAEKLDS